jgi:uncharacterized protein (TIGR02231 family)
MRLPELDALFIDGGAQIAKVAGTSGSFSQANSVWLQLNEGYNSGKAMDYRANLQRQQQTAKRVAQVFDQLQERGTTAHFDAGVRAIRSDGRLVRAGIGSAQLRASQRVLAAPTVSLNAARTLDLVNSSGQPLLPGKTSLYVRQAFVGATELPFVAEGEKFSMFGGVADRIKLARTLDKKRSELRRWGKRTRVAVSYVVTVENLASFAEVVDLSERIPVSNVESVEISRVDVQPNVDPDSKGIIRWKQQLKAGEKRRFRVEYTMEYPTALLARVDPAMRKSNVLFQEIDMLENNL